VKADVTSETSAQGKKSSGSSIKLGAYHHSMGDTCACVPGSAPHRTKKFNGSIEFFSPSRALLIQLYSKSARQLIYKIRREKRKRKTNAVSRRGEARDFDHWGHYIMTMLIYDIFLMK
jgi:hypothetical protein